MADLGGRRRFGGDRGQIILVAAFALAVTFVALALVVNSAIFTENLASRGETGGSEDALLLRHEVEVAAGQSLRYANVHNTSTHITVRDAFRDGLGNVTAAIERQHATRGAFVNVTYVSRTDGSRVAQNGSTSPRRAFTSAGPSPSDDWAVVDDVEREPGANGTRAFEMNVTKASLATSGAGAFTVDVEEYDRTVSNPPSYTVTVHRDGVGSDVIVVETAKPGGATAECRRTVTKAYVRVHLTRGLLDGEPCDALRRDVDPAGPSATNFRFGAGVGGRYNLSFVDGDRARGNYSLVTTNSSFGSTKTLNATGSRDSPYVTDAAYATIVRFWYDSTDLHYDTRVRVAPEENP